MMWLGLYLIGFSFFFSKAYKIRVEGTGYWIHTIGVLIAASLWPVLLAMRFVLKQIQK